MGFTLFSLECENAVWKINFNFKAGRFVMKLMGLMLPTPRVHGPFPRPGQGPNHEFKGLYTFEPFEAANYFCTPFLKESHPF